LHIHWHDDHVRSKVIRRSSDLDILLEFEQAPTIYEFIRRERNLSEELGVKADLVIKKTLLPQIGKRILEEVMAV
jgi:predicted nucleotidyltransferase